MSATRLVTVLGGLSAFATVSWGKDADTPNGAGEYWSEVEDLQWVRRDGKPGASFSEQLFEKAMSYGNDYEGCNIIEQVEGTLGYEQAQQEEMAHAAASYQRGWLAEGYLIHDRSYFW